MLFPKDFDGVIAHRGTPVKLPYEFSWNTPATFSFVTKQGTNTSDIVLDNLKRLSLGLDGSEDLSNIQFLDLISKEWKLEKHIVQEKIVLYDLPKRWTQFQASLYLVEGISPKCDLILCIGYMGELGRTSIAGLLYKASIIHSDPVLQKLFKKY